MLAHPATIHLPDKQLRKLVKDLAACGLVGIEAYYDENHPDNIARFSGWAAEYGLVCTGGTDYHGSSTSDLKLGTGFGRLRVPDEALAQLKAAVEAARTC